MLKRGQITLFAVIAIMIIGAVLVFLVIKPSFLGPKISKEEAAKIVAEQTQAVKDKIEGCMKTVTVKTLNTMGRQGGYIIPRVERFSIPSSVMADSPTISYALFSDKERKQMTLFPSLTEMKDEFVIFMQTNPDFPDCINQFQEFVKILDIKSGDLAIDRDNLDFGEKSGQIVVPFKYLTELSKGETKTIIEDFMITVPINLDKITERATITINNVAAGGSTTVLKQNQAKLQEEALRENENSDVMIVSSIPYDLYQSNESGVTYNTRNTLYDIEYNREGLEEPYHFYFLVGEEY